MARPQEIFTYTDKEGITQERQLCSIDGCSYLRMLMKPSHGVKDCRYELTSCCRHRKDGGTFSCHSKPRRKEQIWRAQGIDLTYERYVELIEANGYCCWICGKPQSEEKRALGVDHDHETGKIRGILCRRCNGSIGWLENVTSLDEIQRYLDRDVTEVVTKS